MKDGKIKDRAAGCARRRQPGRVRQTELWELRVDGRSYAVQITYKEMRNIRLRVLAGGEIRLSAPFGMERSLLENFLNRHGDWIAGQVKRQGEVKPLAKQPPLTKEERQQALAYLLPIVDRLYPIVEAYGVAKPHVTVRTMKTRYGSCSVGRGRITLNAMLLKAPAASAEYVVLHELAHFLHPNHSKAFYAFIERYMPDWRERERMLRQQDEAANAR